MKRKTSSNKTEGQKKYSDTPTNSTGKKRNFQNSSAAKKKSDPSKAPQLPKIEGMPKLQHPHKPVMSKPAPVIKDEVRLNKFISNAGICSRRKADELIEQGSVTVNGEVVYEMGHKVKSTDIVTYNGKRVVSENKVYVLLNKPKDFITTTADERGRRTVMELVKHASNGARLYPKIGRAHV